MHHEAWKLHKTLLKKLSDKGFHAPFEDGFLHFKKITNKKKIMKKFKERKGELQRLMINVDNLKVNPVGKSFGEINLKDTFDFNDEVIQVIKISKNDWLDLEYIFVTTI